MNGTLATTASPQLIRWHSGVECCDAVWEAAYSRFESPAEERRKFFNRYRKMNVHRWPRDWHVAEIFCGRGNGLRVLESMGFEHLHGVDLSASLLRQYTGSAQLYLGDCRDLHFEDESLDAVIVQGGLHHLPVLPDDLSRTLDEIRRVLRSGGRFMVIEPWSTPFLRIVHAAARQPIVRKLWKRLDAFQIMTEREAVTYFRWLSRPNEILSELTSRFRTEVLRREFGKLCFLGRKPAA